jgi:hypothetical protein
MRIRHIPAVFAVGIVLSAHTHCASAQSKAGLQTWIEDSGSVPGVHQWFSCVQELQHKPYDKSKAQTCLDSILSHPEIEEGKIVFDEQHDSLTFDLKSPTLTVTNTDFDVSAGELAQFHALLSEDALRIGEPYSRQRELRVWSALDLLFRSQGRRTGVSRTLHLNYDKKTATAAYKIWEGPPGEPQKLAPPYTPPCPITNLNFNWMDVDDYTPVEFVQRQMKIKPMGCFSETDLREDRTRLEGMAFLKESAISVSGSGNTRSFGYSLHGNPITIAKVIVHGYGLLRGLSEKDIPRLTVHTGDTYRRSSVGQQEYSLKKAYERDGWQIKIFTDVQFDSTGKATLDFGVLAYPDDVVYVNEKPYDVTLQSQE